MPNAFSVHLASNHADPGFSQARTPGLKLANAFGVLFQIFKLAHYRKPSSDYTDDLKMI
jgi:hypothetical protein